MTANQQKAVALAVAFIADQRHLADMTDEQWGLLLLASGVSDRRLSPMAVAERVLSEFHDQTGYFASFAASNATTPTAEQDQSAIYFG